MSRQSSDHAFAFCAADTLEPRVMLAAASGWAALDGYTASEPVCILMGLTQEPAASAPVSHADMRRAMPFRGGDRFLALAPAAAEDLVARAMSASRVDLRWTDASSNERGFYVYRAESGGSFNPIATLRAQSEGFADFTAQAGKSYQYRVAAFNDHGFVFSETAIATTPESEDPPVLRGNAARA